MKYLPSNCEAMGLWMLADLVEDGAGEIGIVSP